MAAQDSSCSVNSPKGGDFDSSEICAILAPALVGHDGARIEVTIPAAYRAHARIVTGTGTVLAEGGVSASDKDLDRGSWEKLAAELERQVSTPGEA